MSSLLGSRCTWPTRCASSRMLRAGCHPACTSFGSPTAGVGETHGGDSGSSAVFDEGTPTRVTDRTHGGPWSELPPSGPLFDFCDRRIASLETGRADPAVTGRPPALRRGTAGSAAQPVAIAVVVGLATRGRGGFGSYGRCAGSGIASDLGFGTSREEEGRPAGAGLLDRGPPGRLPLAG